MLKANVSPEFIYKLIANMSKLTHVMIDGGDILDEEELFELLEIGIYVLTVLTRKERDISKSSVKKGFQSDSYLILSSNERYFFSMKTLVREAYFHLIKFATRNY